MFSSGREKRHTGFFLMCLFCFMLVLEITSAVLPSFPECPYGVYPRSMLTDGGFPISTLLYPGQGSPVAVSDQDMSDPFWAFQRFHSLLPHCPKSTVPFPDAPAAAMGRLDGGWMMKYQSQKELQILTEIRNILLKISTDITEKSIPERKQMNIICTILISIAILVGMGIGYTFNISLLY